MATKTATRCAQRLSASKIRTLFWRIRRIPVVGWCSTPFGIKDQDTNFIPNNTRFISRCSTPFGIKDQDTTHFYRVYTILYVLNAFRHQRSGHACFLGPHGTRLCLAENQASPGRGENTRSVAALSLYNRTYLSYFPHYFSFQGSLADAFEAFGIIIRRLAHFFRYSRHNTT